MREACRMVHVKLSHSLACLLRAYPLQTHEILFDAHWHRFRVFGVVIGRGICDNMKTAVDRVGRGKERQINMRFLAMTNHRVYEAEFCNPAAGWGEPQPSMAHNGSMQRKPGALRNGAPFLELPPAFRRLQDDMPR